MNEGLLLVNTGEGKGKTTAALGLGLRAAGHGMKVLMLQFFKGPWPTGECAAVKRLEPDFKIVQLGQGFIRTRKEEHSKATIENAQVSWDRAKQEIFSDFYDIIILDEINNMIYHGLVSVEEVISVLKERPKRLTMILTGRNAHEKVIEMADTVTEMREIKHHYKRGINAQKGIEF
ncbi:Cob(I)yrinic acid a,c-diamide adenosyltransferase [Candidatus Brocadiaceae bacterium B188]|jgi:cob(I)alamin adenosyltransferase|nr:cob(I)yrinic acid a,c-diamide adenosyltransferase [Candidatus Brocadia sapporoensis]MEB2307940.1 cob(I)yrinic acid a,c-diamide adenosyltransferase [Candidatus Brocadiaceae bacterium]OQZ02407.1 MAG: cob(I)yrinic acid a,c-diamide adenosyltransferase [Candidatus Brocadia sp. UTAMX1]QQR65758.1 MAG: cob(I)yrinic acid a,c-diamide adenosyltransferase [Candidatus Brocadia sp.]RZV59738.1 MAG: cob(I)yrinic acid a,c-diamide adenosyltransferase [Candidatus Brocadia sp. BROELEC01]TWU50085.1 Cob(I)yrinic